MQDWEIIKGHYDRGQEDSRLKSKFNFERLRTLDIFSRFLKKAPSVIYDIGGATGVYAFPLSELGYEVHLIEPVESQITFARTQNISAKVPIHSLEIGNALGLKKEDNSADAVLLMGPLYHLISFDERLKAIQEAYRVLKPGGIVFSAAVSRFASFIDLFATGDFDESEIRNMVYQDLKNGQHRSPKGEDFFTTAYFHLPQELKDEHQQAGFQDVKVLGVEGPVWNISDSILEQPGAIENRLLALQKIEEDSHIISASGHFLAIGKKI